MPDGGTHISQQDEPQTVFFARLTQDRQLIDGAGKVVGVGVPSTAYPGELMVCLAVEYDKALREAGL